MFKRKKNKQTEQIASTTLEKYIPNNTSNEKLDSNIQEKTKEQVLELLKQKNTLENKLKLKILENKKLTEEQNLQEFKESDFSAATRNVNQLLNANANINQRLKDITQENAKILKLIEEYKIRHEKYNKDQSEIDVLKNENHKLTIEFEAHKKELAERKEELRKLHEFEKKFNVKIERVLDLKQKNELLVTKIDELKDKQAEIDIEDIFTKIQLKTEEMKEIEIEYEKMKNDFNELSFTLEQELKNTETLEKQHAEITKQETKIGHLKAKMEKQAESNQKVVDKIEEEKNRQEQLQEIANSLFDKVANYEEMLIDYDTLLQEEKELKQELTHQLKIADQMRKQNEKLQKEELKLFKLAKVIANTKKSNEKLSNKTREIELEQEKLSDIKDEHLRKIHHKQYFDQMEKQNRSTREYTNERYMSDLDKMSDTFEKEINELKARHTKK